MIWFRCIDKSVPSVVVVVGTAVEVLVEAIVEAAVEAAGVESVKIFDLDSF